MTCPDADESRAHHGADDAGGRPAGGHGGPHTRSAAPVPGAPPVAGRPAAKVLTVSESVHAGTRQDRSGEALADLLASHGYDVVERRCVPDGVGPVAAALSEMAAGFRGLLVTTGGTGFSPGDLTPEATRSVIEREAPGLAEATRAVSPLGRLSRGVAGTLGTALVVNVPGSPGGATESLEAVLDVVPHALDLLAGGRPH